MYLYLSTYLQLSELVHNRYTIWWLISDLWTGQADGILYG